MRKLFAKKSICTVICAMLCVATLFAVIPVGTSAATPTASVSYDYASGLGSTNVANAAYTANGTSYNDQSKLELRAGADGGKYAVFFPNYDGNNPAHGFVTVPITKVNFADSVRTSTVESVNAKYLLFEMDFTTESEYINGLTMNFQGRYHTESKDNPVSASTYFQILKDSNGFYIKTPNAVTRLPDETGVWSRLSILVDIPQDNTDAAASKTRANFYLNGKLIDSGVQIFSASATLFSEVRINQPINTPVNKTQTFCFDNVLAKTYDEDAEIASILSENKDLTGFSGSTWTDGYVFPSVRAMFDVDGKKYGSVPEVMAALKGGETVTVLRDVPDVLDIVCAITLKNPDGYSINYNANGMTEIKDGTTTVFYDQFESVTVKWHIGDEVIEETYTSLEKATFKGTYPETKVVDGVVYCATGFSDKDGGEVLSDLGYVSATNNEFWLVYSAPLASVTRTDGSVVYLYAVAEVEAAIANSTLGDNILLYSDITLSSFNFKKKVSFTLDLGGHTLTQASNAPNHLFILQGSDSSLTVRNGNVSLVKNIVFIQQDCTGISATIENLNIISSMAAIADVRSGEFTIKGCTASFGGSLVTAFGGTDNENGPTILFEDCTLTVGTALVSTATKDAATRKYSGVIIKNSTVSATTVVGAGYCNKIAVEGGSLDCSILVACGAEDVDVSFGVNTVIKCSRFSTTQGGECTFTVGEGLALANNSDCYIVTDNYANITWSVGTEYVTEAWVKGVTPVCPFEIPEANATVKYTFDEIVPADEDKLYTLVAVPAFTPMMNISLSLDFDLGIYLPAQADIVSVTIAGITHTYEEPLYVDIGGIAYKKYTFYGITPERACDRVLLELVLSGGDFTVEANYEISLVGYVKTILSGGYSQEAEMLAAAVADYIDKAYIYTGKEADTAYAELRALSEAYNLEMAVRTPEGEVFDMSAVSGAVASARFVLDSDLAVRFELNGGYTGRLKIAHYRDGELCSTEINVVNGRYRGREYIDITLDAADLCKKISFAISDGKGGYLEGGYSLYTYIDAMKGKDTKLDALLRSLYSYSVAADAYKATKA